MAAVGGDQLLQLNADWGVDGEQLGDGMSLGSDLLLGACRCLQYLCTIKLEGVGGRGGGGGD